MRAKLACLLTLAWAASACSGVTEPEGETARQSIDQLPSADFSAWLVRPGTDPIPSLRVEGGPGQVTVRGAVTTPYPCYDFEAFVERDGARISLDIVATRRPVICIAVIATFGYEAVIRELPRSTYAVDVTHVVDGQAETVLETGVTVD